MVLFLARLCFRSRVLSKWIDAKHQARRDLQRARVTLLYICATLRFIPSSEAKRSHICNISGEFIWFALSGSFKRSISASLPVGHKNRRRVIVESRRQAYFVLVERQTRRNLFRTHEALVAPDRIQDRSVQPVHGNDTGRTRHNVRTRVNAHRRNVRPGIPVLHGASGFPDVVQPYGGGCARGN